MRKLLEFLRGICELCEDHFEVNNPYHNPDSQKKKKTAKNPFFVENVVTAAALGAFIDGLLSSGSLGGSVVQWFELGIWYKGI